MYKGYHPEIKAQIIDMAIMDLLKPL